MFVATSEQVTDALDLYKAGADYVVVPHLLGGDHISEKLKKHKDSFFMFKREGQDQFKELKKRLKHL